MEEDKARNMKILKMNKSSENSHLADDDAPRATVAKKGEKVTVEDILRNAQINIDNPDIIAAFGVESKKSVF